MAVEPNPNFGRDYILNLDKVFGKNLSENERKGMTSEQFYKTMLDLMAIFGKLH